MKRFFVSALTAVCALTPVFAENEITVLAGETAVNDGIITANGEVQKTAGASTSIHFYGMAAQSGQPFGNRILRTLTDAENATLTNNGTINLNYKEMVAQYVSELDDKDSTIESQKKYETIMGRGMLAGKNSTLTNNGTISVVYDIDPDSTYKLIVHAMYAGDGSTITNNGSIAITGSGCYGAQARGMTSPNNVNIINNGTVYIDLDRSDIVRALALAGTVKDGCITNSGTVFARSNAMVLGLATQLYGGKTNLNTGYITAISNGQLPQYLGYARPGTVAGGMPCALAMAASQGSSDTGILSNEGIVRAYIQGDNASPYAVANGMAISKVVGTATLKNTGIIDVFSSVSASDAPNGIVRVSEIGINTFDYGYGTVKITDFATTLRDFAAKKDFIQAYGSEIDFSEANLILRPSDGYTAGTSYTVSGDTLVTKVDTYYLKLDTTNNTYTVDSMPSTANSDVPVTGMDSIAFTSALPDFYTVRTVRSGTGDDTSYSVSLVLNNDSGAAKDLVTSAAMLPVDFVRLNMDMIDRELDTTDRLARKVYVSPFASFLSRDGDTDSHVFGGLFGFDWGFGELLTAGVHGSYAFAKSDDGEFQSENDLSGFGAGLHAALFPAETWWVRAQASFFRTTGDTEYAMTESTGNALLSESSNDANVLYASLFGGKTFEIPGQNEIRPEIGFSYLHFFDAPELEWSYMGYHIAGYDMEMTSYKALYGTAKVSFIHDFAKEKDGGSLLASAGLRGRLYAPEVTLTMLDDEFDDGAREDAVQGLFELSYRHKIGQFFIDAGYRGVFGADSRNHQIHLTGKFTF